MATLSSFSYFPDGFGAVRPVVVMTADGAIDLTDGDKTITFAIPAGVLALTLAAPAYVGQQLWLVATTDAGGSVTVTSASAINLAGNTIMTFDGARSGAVKLEAISATNWRIVVNNTVALS